MTGLGYDVLATVAYGGVGTLLMALGFVLVDVATPGKLPELIWRDGNRNAAVVLGSGLLGVGMIVTTAILTSADELAAGLLSTAIYGLIGIALMAVAFVLIDVVTPGKLGATLTDPEPQPAAWITAVVHVAISAIIAASVS
ncbi:MAG: DUF350 domain-containing protein [Thermocrispum sp.]